MNTPKELRAKAYEIGLAARSRMNDIKADNSNGADIDAEVERMFAEASTYEARAKRLEQLDDMDSGLNAADVRRPNEDRSITTESAETRAKAAFEQYIRTGSDNELRAQSVGTASEGGYLVPVSLGDRIIETLKYAGPMFDPSVTEHIDTDRGERINWPTNDDTANEFATKAENAAQSDTSIVLGTKPLDAYSYGSGIVKVSLELLQDAAFPIEAFIAKKLGQRMGRTYNKLLTTGSGTDAPNGIITALGTPALTTTASLSTTLDDVLNLIHSVDPAYRVNGSLMGNDAMVLALRKMKDSDGQYLWQPSVQAGVAGELFGYKVLVNNAMTGVPTTAGHVPLAFGDFKNYVVRKVKGLSLQRLNERYAEAGQIAFIGHVRFDGDLMDAGAIKGLRVKA